MVTAIVLIKTHHGLLNEVAETLADMEQVSEVYSVCGNYDAVAVLRVKNNDAIADLVTGKMLQIEGITETETMIAFRTCIGSVNHLFVGSQRAVWPDRPRQLPFAGRFRSPISV